MKKSRFIIFLALVIVVTSLLGYTYFASNNPEMEKLFNYAKQIRNTKEKFNNENGKMIMAEANGIPITVEEFEVKRKAYTFEGYSENDYKEVLQRLARTKVLFKMAQDEGLDINFDEALSYSLTELEAVSKDKEALDRINVYIEALGLSSEAYWKEYHVNEVILFKSITRLKNKIIEDAIKANKLQAVSEEKALNVPQEHIDFVNDYIANIEKEIKIEIKMDEYKEKIKL